MIINAQETSQRYQEEREMKGGFFDKQDFEYCSSERRTNVVYGLTIGYPLGIMFISIILLGLGKRIPVINIFISPCIFSALVVMIDRIVCNEDTMKVIITSGIYLAGIFVELIIIFITRIFYRETDFYDRLFASHSILMELWNGNFNHNAHEILQRYMSVKPEGKIVGRAFHYSPLLLNKKNKKEYTQLMDEEIPFHDESYNESEEEDDEYFNNGNNSNLVRLSKLLTSTTFTTHQQIPYVSWDKLNKVKPKIPSNSLLRITIKENIKLSPEIVQSQNTIYEKIKETIKDKDVYHNIRVKWQTPNIYHNFYVVQSKFLDFLLRFKIFGLIYCLSMILGLNLLVDCIWRFLETPYKFYMKKGVSHENNLTLKW